jgi:fatty-acyl-CoA synthase
MINTKIITPTPSAYCYQLLISLILEQPLRFNPEAEIVYRNVSRYTYRDLYQRVSRLANLLTGRLGISPGETVAVIDYDSHRFLEGYFAIPMIGAVLHTINFRLSSEDMLYTIHHAEDKLIFCHRDFLPLLEKMRDQIKDVTIVVIGDGHDELVSSIDQEGEYEALLSIQKEEYEFPDFDEDSIATIFFTTGTTGLPKAVCFSHRQLVLHTMALATTLGAMNSIVTISSEDVYMPVTPMFHSHAWGLPYVATFLAMKQVYPGKYEAGMLLKLKREERVTISHGVPTILEMICDHPDAGKKDLGGWKMICGGSALPKGLATRALSLGINVITGYGMSETCPVISLSNPYEQIMSGLGDDEKVNTRLRAGIPIHLSDVKLRNDAGEFVANDGLSQGELVVRSPWAVNGYFNDPVRSEELWKDGYLHTGDIGTIDKSGFIDITDRMKDVIKSGGEWVSSELIESLLSTYPGIAEVAVVAMPDEKWMERPMAVIVTNANETITKDSLNQYLQQFVSNGKLKSFAVPKEYRFVSELPKTSTGKIDKKRIRIQEKLRKD